MVFFSSLLGSCSCHCHVRPGRMCCTGGSPSAQRSQVAANLPGLVEAGVDGLLLVLLLFYCWFVGGFLLSHKLSHVKGSNKKWGFSVRVGGAAKPG